MMLREGNCQSTFIRDQI